MGKVSMKALKKFNTNVQTWQELTQSWNDVLEEEKQLIADKDKMGITSEQIKREMLISKEVIREVKKIYRSEWSSESDPEEWMGEPK